MAGPTFADTHSDRRLPSRTRCATILSVPTCIMLILSRPELLAAAKALLAAVRDLFR
ncbi:MAG TPA: hypothetical protein VHY31_16775 [Streptosporangiaceae bacterium]|jgi:hypothetical protein|nr:hypothetical protein [Streptosporangiaceae bacterium]